MAFFTLKLKSQALASTTTVRLYYPCDLPAEVGNEVKGVITLLHGYTNDGDDWVNMSAALRYAADNGLAMSRRIDVVTKEGKAPKRIIIEMKRKIDVIRREKIAIRDRHGNYTDEYARLTGDFYKHLN